MGQFLFFFALGWLCVTAWCALTRHDDNNDGFPQRI